MALGWFTLAHSACNSARHLKEGQYLLKSNSVEFTSNKYLTAKSELTDKLLGAIVQKPNSSFIVDGFKPKLFLYNMRYNKYQNDSNNFQLESRSVEAPVIYDSTTIVQSESYMESYLFHQGYFYAKVKDTTVFNQKRKKASVTYEVNTGINYLISRVYFEEIKDSAVKSFVREAFGETFLRSGKAYSADLVEKERSRITSVLKEKGYYYFSNNNISFVLDTTKKEYKRIEENVLTSATDFISKKEETRPTLDIYINITSEGEDKAFRRCAVNKIYVFPDFEDKRDATDSTMIVKKIQKTTFRYHDYYIRSKVIHNHIFVSSDKYYAQSDYDKTITELNQLGVFSTVRAIYIEDSTRDEGGLQWLNFVVMMSRAKKYDYSANLEGSTGTTYTLGSGITLSFRNNNVARGANLFTTTVNGGVESQVDSAGQFHLLTRTASINTSLEFPKFLFPIGKERYSIRNTPRTEVALGANLLERVTFFDLVNLTSRFTYKWRETSTKNWEVSPFFVNDISIKTSDQFQARLDTNEFLRNSYRETFIEGENITWIYSNAAQAKFYDDYSYIRLGIEEAGGLVGGLNKVSPNLTASYSQYVRLDYDLRHYIKQKHSTTALRLSGGIGVPYGISKTSTLPYLKQYFVGGPFSMRGWKIRTLGPGSYVDTTGATSSDNTSAAFIDRTGDIKIEMSGEYRFNIFKLFSGLLQFNGAAFADAGNIWLANKSSSYFDAEFHFKNLYRDFAVDGGLGIRIDISSLFVLRVDAAIPLKVPGDNSIVSESYLKQGWIVQDIDLLYNKWWQKNLVWNIAIGYPF
ncbi:MAG: BamA/TamA family outer membrane protein [Chitinophagaceae bacterium]|nr:BamA/TamA family outer membrane protein [Chitinophagaceae bacterium]